jgi:hypothetical protein
MKDLEPAELVRRYEYADPGGLIHIAVKKPGRFDRIGHRITSDRKGQSSGRGVGWELKVIANGNSDCVPECIDGSACHFAQCVF